jgi:hypothetical protein
MSILIRYTPSSLTREQYDKVNEILHENGPGGPPPPLQLHVMFGEGSDLRVSEIWESEEAWQQARTTDGFADSGRCTANGSAGSVGHLARDRTPQLFADDFDPETADAMDDEAVRRS